MKNPVPITAASLRMIDPNQFAKAYTDIRYAAESPQQALDVFLPEADGVWPVVVFVHGGGWFAGSRRNQHISFVFKILSQGYAVATVDYRLAPDYTFPAAIQDVKAAIRYLRAHAAELQIDTSRLVIWGNSAGAHLSALAAAPHVIPELEDLSMGNGQESSRVDGLIAWYGVYDFAALQRQAGRVGEVEGRMLGAWRGKAELASPIHYVSEDFPPVLLQHGTADEVVSYKQSEIFFEEIQRTCGPDRAVLEHFEGAGHGDARIKDDANILRCVRFLDSIYYPDSPCPYARKAIPEIQFLETDVDCGDHFELA